MMEFSPFKAMMEFAAAGGLHDGMRSLYIRGPWPVAAQGFCAGVCLAADFPRETKYNVDNAGLRPGRRADRR